jgi:pantoate kinase
MVEVRAYSPCHVTGFFEIHDEAEDPLRRGSKGAGISLEMGVVTSVSLRRSAKSRAHFKINGLTCELPVSANVVKKLLSKSSEIYEVIVEHSVLAPMGAGFGTSGAGALSLALALNEALGAELSREEAAQVAHLAEVECRTGLGTVITELYGGFEVRTEPGAPGVGKLKRLPLSGDYFVVAVSLGPISTKAMLGDRSVRRRINEAGRSAMTAFMRSPSLGSFLGLSRKFSDEIGLESDRIRCILRNTDEQGLRCSMNMFGEAVFTVVNSNEAEKAFAVFEAYANSDRDLVVSPVEYKGARLI